MSVLCFIIFQLFGALCQIMCFLLHNGNPLNWGIGHSVSLCPFISPSLHIQDDAGKLLGAQGPGNLSERGRGLLSGLGCV